VQDHGLEVTTSVQDNCLKGQGFWGLSHLDDTGDHRQHRRMADEHSLGLASRARRVHDDSHRIWIGLSAGESSRVLDAQLDDLVNVHDRDAGDGLFRV